MILLNGLLRTGSLFALFGLYALSLPVPGSGQVKTVKIGLLVADTKSIEAKQGAEMAIRNANQKGGFNNIPFQLVVRSMDGPWGTGSKQAVDLIFEEEVWAIMGSHDGRNAHLVEQVSAKARIVFLSSWASDPTLSQAFVPWYFSCVPNDNQQAAALIEEIYKRRKINKIAVLSDNGYDSKMAVESFLKKSKQAGKTTPLPYYYENTSLDFNGFPEQILKADIEAIILFGQPGASLKLFQLMQIKKMKQPVFASLSVLAENDLPQQEWKKFKEGVMIPSCQWSTSKFQAFLLQYQRNYGRMPGAAALYAYDGMNLIIAAIQNSGLDREKIQKSLLKIHFDGITGSIQFDSKGNRL
jgi:branched-chain amino acid transport system substrate-binding protein